MSPVAINGVEQVVPHEDTHVSGGSDGIDSALVIAGMANLANTKVWQGNVGNRPVEVDLPAGYIPPTRSFWIFPADPYAQYGSLDGFAYQKLDAGAEYCCAGLAVPSDFGSLVSVKVVYIDRTSDTFDYTVATSFGAAGQAYTTHTDSVTADGVGMTDTIIKSLDVTDAFTGLAADDFVGIKMTMDALTGSAEIAVIGFLFTYSES
ncbi:hypothetical protein ES708_05910 [subsurface metagenome]